MSWSTVALATGPAAVTGALGYFTARMQSRATLRQAEVVLERQFAQHHEDHLRHRQGTYHNLLDELAGLDLMLLNRDIGDVEDWSRGFRHHLNGAYLYGTSEVRSAAVELSDVIGALADDGNMTQVFREWESTRRQAYVQKRDGLIDAMRADVGPGSLQP